MEAIDFNDRENALNQSDDEVELEVFEEKKNQINDAKEQIKDILEVFDQSEESPQLIK